MKRFEDRINNPQNYGYIDNGDGTRSTHLMSAEYDALGRAWAFPMIVQDGMGLRQFKSKQEALDWNIKNNNAKYFDSIEEADHYSQNYKTDAFKEHYKQRQQPSNGLLNSGVARDLLERDLDARKLTPKNSMAEPYRSQPYNRDDYMMLMQRGLLGLGKKKP